MEAARSKSQGIPIEAGGFQKGIAMSSPSQPTGSEGVSAQNVQPSFFGTDKASAERRLNPYPWYSIMREEHPVFYSEIDQLWFLFRYADVKHVLTDHTTFSSEQGPGQLVSARTNDKEGILSRSLLLLDPPYHKHMREFVSQAFTPRRIDGLAERITTMTNELLDAVVEQGYMDMVADFSDRLPTIVIMEMLGLPCEDFALLKRLSNDIALLLPEQSGPALEELIRYMKRVVTLRRVTPGDDLISALCTAEIAGKQLSEREIVILCTNVLIAGNETSTNLLNNSILCFDEHPEVMDELRVDSSLIPGAIEEVLRFLSPTQWIFRSSLIDTVIGGTEIKAGQMIYLGLGSANRDEAQFPLAESFDIRRTPNRHIAFGHGIHFCLGAPLARLEVRIALEVLLKRLTHIRRVREVPLEIPTGITYQVKSLPITFEKLSQNGKR